MLLMMLIVRIIHYLPITLFLIKIFKGVLNENRTVLTPPWLISFKYISTPPDIQVQIHLFTAYEYGSNTFISFYNLVIWSQCYITLYTNSDVSITTDATFIECYNIVIKQSENRYHERGTSKRLLTSASIFVVFITSINNEIVVSFSISIRYNITSQSLLMLTHRAK